MKLRKLAVLSLTVAVALVFSGCTKEQTAEEKGTAASEKSSVSPETVSKSDKSGVTLSFMASQDWIQDAEIDLSKKIHRRDGD